jgi:L-amino acid N-acyltransferase YncA
MLEGIDQRWTSRVPPVGEADSPAWGGTVERSSEKGIRVITAASMFNRLQPSIAGYQYDHYRFYPSIDPDGWMDLLLRRLQTLLDDDDVHLVYSEEGGGQALIAVRVSSWDMDHFGFSMATLALLFHNGGISALEDCLSRGYAHLAGLGVRFASVRINGDQLEAIHILGDHGFRYVENIIWPILNCSSSTSDFLSFGVREMQENDLSAAVSIAENSQYQRGHFHCDEGFAKDRVNGLYGKWVRSAWEEQRPIIIIEDGGRVAGYFVLDLLHGLSSALGTPYGGMRSLGVDLSARGKGLGHRLFRGAIAYLKSRGAEYIESGYASKNHVSARLHSRAGFYSVYEEVTLHRWLD